MTIRSRQSTYRPQSEDTTVEADRLMFDLYRRLTPAERCARVVAAARAGEALELAGVRLHEPGASDAEQRRRLMSRRAARLAAAGHSFDQASPAMTESSHSSDPLDIALRVIAVFDALDIAYAVGGAIASAVHGEPRFTEDVDIAADVRDRHVPDLIARLREAFLVPEEQVHRAVREGTSFSVIHVASVRKVDVFVVGEQPLRRGQLERRQPVDLGSARLHVVSPEDIVLQKLIWYRKGGEVSERQWRDVLGVLKLQGDRLDAAYLRDGARAGDTAALLERALREAGLQPPR